MLQRLDDQAPVGLVATNELLGIPTDAAQDVRHRPAALPPSPTQDERSPMLGVVEEALTQVSSHIFGDIGGADFLCRKRRNLFV